MSGALQGASHGHGTTQLVSWRRLGVGCAVFGLALAAAACGASSATSATSATSTTRATSPVIGLFDAGLADTGSSSPAKLTQALHDFDTVVAISSSSRDDLLAEYDIGVVEQELGETSGAYDAYNKALLISPDYTRAIYNLAVLETSPAPRKAAAYYRRLLTLDPHNANVDFNYGLLLRSLGQETEGNAEVASALKLDPALASRLPPNTTSPPGSPSSSSAATTTS